MKTMKIESVKASSNAAAAKAANAAARANPFYAASYQKAAALVASLFWSVFGPAAQYWFQYSKIAYAAASVKPYRP